MIDSDEMSRMYGQIVAGVPKEQSTLAATDDEHSQFWDQCATEVAQMREADPNVIFDVVGEVPSVADVPDQGDEPDPAGQPEEPDPAPTDQPADQPADQVSPPAPGDQTGAQ